MKIYVASSWRNEQQPAVVARLRAEGHEVYDFRNPTEGDHGFSWRQTSDEPPPWSAIKTREVLQRPIAERGFKLDFAAMQWADACVMVQPCGRSAALELGWFAGAGKLTFVLLADGQEPELMLKAANHLCVSLDEVVAALKTAGSQDINVMVKVAGQSFRCEECSSNVFTRTGGRYSCNGCGAKYIGE